MAQKKSVSISIDKGIDDFFQKHINKVINIEGHEILITKSKNQLYNLALEYALENANEWLVFGKKDEN